MKVLMLNGSPQKKSNVGYALDIMKNIFEAEGIETEIVQIGNKEIHGCRGCNACFKLGKCVFDDDPVNEINRKFEEADGLVLASPVYYASPNGTLVSFLDRLFYSHHFDATMKVGASVAVARRAGTTATIDVLNKYLMHGGLAIASSTYWPIAHGNLPGEVAGDGEGLQTFRNLARNMVFLMKSIELGKKTFGIPDHGDMVMTNFIR